MAFHFSCLKFETLSDSGCSLCIIHYNYINNNCVFCIKQFITWLGSWFVIISMVRDLLCQYQCDWLAGKCRLRNDLLRVESYVKTCRLSHWRVIVYEFRRFIYERRALDGQQWRIIHISLTTLHRARAVYCRYIAVSQGAI